MARGIGTAVQRATLRRNWVAAAIGTLLILIPLVMVGTALWGLLKS